MKDLGLSKNIIRNLFIYVSWILDPQKAVNLAKKIEKEIEGSYKKEKVAAIGYLNEFFAKYLEFGKTNEEVVKLNQEIDSHKKTNNKIVEALSQLREIRLRVKKINKGTTDQVLPVSRSFGISLGIVEGKILNVTSTKQKISENCIGIFPTAGAKYDNQFLKCKGIIFKNGSVTSHGAILAREFNVPAVVSPNIKIKDGERVQINGSNGDIKLVDTDI
jgi:pyruvate,water dikinase